MVNAKPWPLYLRERDPVPTTKVQGIFYVVVRYSTVAPHEIRLDEIRLGHLKGVAYVEALQHITN